MTIIQKGLTAPVESLHAGKSQIYRFIVSTDQEDRDGDIIKQDGWDFDEFNANPIALLQHDHKQPIGKWTNIHKRTVNGVNQTVADLILAPPASDLLKYAYALVTEGILNATSVGFRVKNAEKRKDASGRPQRGHIITKAVLHEISVVSVPANQNAIRIAKSMSISDDIVKSFVSFEGSDSTEDLEGDLDQAVLQRAKNLLSRGASVDEKPTQKSQTRNIWDGLTKPELLEAVKRAKAVLK